MNIIGYHENCTDCGPGKYSTALGATAATTCVSCAEGKFSDKTRASQVIQLLVGVVVGLQRGQATASAASVIWSKSSLAWRACLTATCSSRSFHSNSSESVLERSPLVNTLSSSKSLCSAPSATARVTVVMLSWMSPGETEVRCLVNMMASGDEVALASELSVCLRWRRSNAGGPEPICGFLGILASEQESSTRLTASRTGRWYGLMHSLEPIMMIFWGWVAETWLNTQRVFFRASAE